MAGVTDLGFETKTFEEITDSIDTTLTSEEGFGASFATGPDSTSGIITRTLAGGMSDLWALGQAIASQQNLSEATGVYLEYLAGLVKIYRLTAAGSTGSLLFTGSSGATIPAYFPVADAGGRNVLTQASLTLNRAACYQTTISVKTVTPLTLYTINVLGSNYDYTSFASTSITAIVAGLVASMSAAIEFSAEVVEDTVVITYGSSSNMLYTTNTANLSLTSVGGVVEGESATEGELTFEADTLTTLVGTNLNVTSVTNPSDFTVGRLEETDEELRVRVEEGDGTTGAATKPNIESTLLNISGVTAVLVNQNETLITDANGVPPKAYETFVSGGSEADIAEGLWDSKPACIPTYGNITRAVVDHNGDVQAVSFSRPTQLYSWVRVTYEINNEETFPSDGESQMKQAVVTTGDGMYRGEDFDPNKFYGNLYTIPGVFISSIEIATTASDTDTPSYQTSRIPVTKTEDLAFDVSRVIITT